MATTMVGKPALNRSKYNTSLNLTRRADSQLAGYLWVSHLSMILQSKFGSVELISERAYTFGSVDNVRQYKFEKHFDKQYVPSSRHGVLLNGEPLAVFGSSGGGTGIHDHSAILMNDDIYLAVGNHLACMALQPFKLKWVLQPDETTCFGIYYEPRHSALLSHGELEIARLSTDGKILWHSSGADTFTGEFELHPEYIQVTDFNGKIYRFSYDDGNEI